MDLRRVRRRAAIAAVAVVRGRVADVEREAVNLRAHGQIESRDASRSRGIERQPHDA